MTRDRHAGYSAKGFYFFDRGKLLFTLKPYADCTDANDFLL